MSAAGVILSALGRRGSQKLADKIAEALDEAGYLIAPGEPLVVWLEDRAVTRLSTLADGVTLLHNGDAVIGIEFADGIAT